jgi:hypothetical protein
MAAGGNFTLSDAIGAPTLADMGPPLGHPAGYNPAELQANSGFPKWFREMPNFFEGLAGVESTP